MTLQIPILFQRCLRSVLDFVKHLYYIKEMVTLGFPVSSGLALVMEPVESLVERIVLEDEDRRN